ncbi:MAG: PSD1 and planctomycete cytochrome C domain-containing protein [Verrucomicrobiales bacterium]
MLKSPRHFLYFSLPVLLGVGFIVPLFQAEPAGPTAHSATGKLDFNQSIRPILNQHCTACHGGVKKAGGISFLFREEAMVAGESGKMAITPGIPAQSSMLDRVVDTKDPMPPPEHGHMLGEREVKLLRQWIEEGAEWSDHWAFVAPKRPVVPAAPEGLSPIDAFVRARLTKEGLSPAPEADRAEWLRRVSFDLVGLPPTPEEIEAFLADRENGAYERVVDRLLESPRYGERWAAVWMDLARYADTKGYEKDPHRDMWPWRDWLIRSLNANRPYDQMITDIMAGDLIPGGTLDQKLATAFHRNTQANTEGGTDDEEFRTTATLDRIATSWAALSGISFNCVQCHTHPYDPIRHQEYYQFLAFFNNSKDADLSDDFPKLRVPSDAGQFEKMNALQNELNQLRPRALAVEIAVAEDAAWNPLSIEKASSKPEAEMVIRGTMAEAVGTVASGARYEIIAPLPEGAISGIRLKVPVAKAPKAVHSPEPGFIISRVKLFVVAPDGAGETEVSIARVADSSSDEPRDPRGVLRDDNQGFSAEPVQHRDRYLLLLPAQALALAPGSKLRVEIRHGQQISEKPAVTRRLEIAVSADAKWTSMANDETWRAELARYDAATTEMRAIPGTDVPVLVERAPDNGRATHVFIRGNWLEKDKTAVAPGVPHIFPSLPEGKKADRLALAQWMVSPEHPLTARVAGNRLWEQLFGTGLVETLEDFGSVGLPPSHPELLDWLAIRFRDDLQWDTKTMLRELVLSATYRQSNRIGTGDAERDPRNRLLARGPRVRLTSEMVRDQALATAGILSPKMYGAPVMPPQPDGVWRSVYSGAKWNESKGEDARRRAVYTYWKRTSPYPSFLSFDAPTRDVCTVRRLATNTPLQALVTLNDPVFVEAARALGKLAIERASGDLPAAISHAVLRVTGQPAAEAEITELISLHSDALATYRADAALLKDTDEADAEAAAMTTVSMVILNFDRAMSK